MGLLIGIKNIALEPVLEFQLPNGLGVFKSQLADKNGSRLCYGGPHEIFSTVNSQVQSVSHLNVFFTQMIHQYRNSLYPALSCTLEPELQEIGRGVFCEKEAYLSHKLKTNEGTEVSPTAVDEIDLEEMNGETIKEVDEICICSPLENPVPCSSTVHKARIPISRRKEYLDQEDMAFIDGYRCQDCSLCKKCMVTDRNKMTSLQDKIEQEAIQNSVFIDEKGEKVYVDLPFIKPQWKPSRKSTMEPIITTTKQEEFTLVNVGSLSQQKKLLGKSIKT